MLRKLTKSKSSKNITDLIPVFKGFNWIQEFVMMGLVPFQKEWHDAAQTLCVCVKIQALGLLQIHSFHPPIFSVAYSILCHRRCWSLSQLTLDERRGTSVYHSTNSISCRFSYRFPLVATLVSVLRMDAFLQYSSRAQMDVPFLHQYQFSNTRQNYKGWIENAFYFLSLCALLALRLSFNYTSYSHAHTITASPQRVG